MSRLNLLSAALDYAARGWRVVPLHSPTPTGCSCGRARCASPAKHPRTSHGLKDASRDAETIRDWWTLWPDANIGVATGPESGIVVLDVDGAAGLRALAEYAAIGLRLPDTFVVTTGRGRHYYFQYPAGLDVRNSANKIGRGLDIRGTDDYVVAAQSRHISGAPYECIAPDKPLAPVPEWLLSLINGKSDAQAAPAPATGAIIGKGGRTNRLVSLAGTLHRRGMSVEAITAALLAENAVNCEPPLPEEKVRAIAHDIPARYPNAPDAQKGDGPKSVRRPDLVCLADVAPRAVQWLWPPYLALGMLGMLSGDPGAGKTFVALAAAAAFTNGHTPSGTRCTPIDVLYLSLENAPAEVVRPRFDALGGDATRLHLLRGSLWSEDGQEQQGAVSLSDVPILDAALEATQAKLIVIDPIQSYLGAGIDLHRSNQTRPVLDGLAKLAEKHGCAVLLLRHLSKQVGGKAIHRGLGSIDLTGAVRSELLAGSLPDDDSARALVHVKSNIGAIGPSLGYSIDASGHFAWTGRSNITAEQMLDAPASGEDRSAKAEAVEWLRDVLIRGSLEQQEVRRQAETAGIAYRTLRRAKDTLGVISRKGAMAGAWIWSLPEVGQRSPHTKTWTPSAPLDNFEGVPSTKKAKITPLDTEEGQDFYVREGGHLRDDGSTARRVSL